MTVEQKIVLSFIKTAVSCSPAELTKESFNWTIVIDFATKQGVQGLCLDALELLPKEERPDKAMLLEWVGRVVGMERLYESHLKAVDALACFYQQYGIKMMLLKGYGVSLYWPRPNHRPAGDMDIYLGPNWKRADQLVGEQLGIVVDDGHEHHTCFVFQGTSVENHYDFVNTKVNESSRELEVLFKKLATFDKSVTTGKGAIFLPSSTLNAIFLVRHLGQHFAGAEATLRQLLDYGFFIQHETANVDWKQVCSTLKKAGMFRLFQQINAICVDYLGFSESLFPQIEREPALEKRIIEDILSPEFAEEKPKGTTLQVVWFKTRRFLANRWKRKLVYREGMWSQLWYGSIAHIQRFGTIKD